MSVVITFPAISKDPEASVVLATWFVADVADDEQGPDRLPLPPFPADFDRHVQDRLEGLEWNGGLDRPEVVRGETLEMLAQADHGQGIEGLRLESRVDHDDFRPRTEQVVGDRLDQRERDPLTDRDLVGLDVEFDGDQARALGGVKLATRGRGDVDRDLIDARSRRRVPVDGAFGKNQNPHRADLHRRIPGHR